MKIKERLVPYLFAFIALFSWGIHGPAGRYLALQNVDMYFVFAARFWIGSGVIFLYLLFKRKLQFNWKENFWQVLGIVAVGIYGNSLLYHVTLKYLPATLVMILENLSPIFVILMTLIILKTKPTKKQIISLIIALAGLFFIIAGKEHFEIPQENFLLGIILGVLTGLSFGYYIFFSAALVKPFKDNRIKITQFLFKILFISALLSIPFLIRTNHPPQTTKEWFWLFEMGIFQSGLSYLFWYYALSYLPANEMSILFLLTVFFTTINEVLFLNLNLNFYLIIGGLLILSGAYIVKRRS